MLTLQELKRKVGTPRDGARTPTARHLRESGVAVAYKSLGNDAEIIAYQNGYALYQVGRHFTVFPIHSCGGYLYVSRNGEDYLTEQFFGKERWYVRLVLEGEDRLSRNQEERERHISYSDALGGWGVLEDLVESVLGHLMERELIGEMLQALTRRQKAVVLGCVLQGKTQGQVSKELGISRPAVADALAHAIRKIQKGYLPLACQPSVGKREGEDS